MPPCRVLHAALAQQGNAIIHFFPCIKPERRPRRRPKRHDDSRGGGGHGDALRLAARLLFGEFRYDGPHARDTTSTMYQLNGAALAGCRAAATLGGDATVLARQLAEPAPGAGRRKTMALTVNSDAIATAQLSTTNTLVALRANGQAYWTFYWRRRLSCCSWTPTAAIPRDVQKGLTCVSGARRSNINLIDGPILDDGTP